MLITFQYPRPQRLEKLWLNDDSEVRALSQTMLHSVETHKRYYESVATDKSAARVHKLLSKVASDSEDDFQEAQ